MIRRKQIQSSDLSNLVLLNEDESEESRSRVILGLDRLMKEASWGIEDRARDLFIYKLAESRYAELNPSFLESRAKESKSITFSPNYFPVRIDVLLPKFAVYNLNESSFKINISVQQNGSWGPIKISKEFEPELPNILRSPLMNAISIKPKRRYPYGESDFSFETSFVGLIPQQVKREMDIAKKIFDNQLYVIAETKWGEAEYLIKDPLLVGVRKDKSFLVSKFYTTSIEEYAIGGKNARQ